MIPDCTIITSFYKKNIDSTISCDIDITKIELLLKLPVYLVFFTENEFIEILKLKRKEYGFSDITLIIERKFENLLKQNKINSESHILSCSKFDFVLNTINFNPFNTTHGGPNSNIRHVGDLGNIYTDNIGTCRMKYEDNMIKLRGYKQNIIGRSIVIHAQKDDLGLGGDEESLKTGNAGARIACAVIGYSKKMC